ncbi:MAG TPA: type IVB secretion system protein IcmH/DotU [Vineibacter sp.]|nr:type IVB secretion system protein IcmH/DotU [Vineibacter sp.]
MAGNPNDPFGDSGGENRTVVRPGAGRPQPVQAPPPPVGQPAYPAGPQQPPSGFDSPPAYQAPPQPQQQQQGGAFAGPNQQGRLAAVAAGRPGGSAFDVADLARGTGSPLAAAAVPLLGLSARLRAMTGQVDVNAVRESVYQELHGFAKAGREGGVQPELLRASHYAVAATIDDVVMNTPWGAHSGWNKRTMVSAFHGDVEGGERFYAYLERMTQAPTVNRPALQIMYDCMSLGFLGRYRLRARGPAEHDQVREKVWQILRNLAGPLERELSPDWRGVDAPAKLSNRAIPAWLVAAIAALLAFLIFGALLIALSVRADATDGPFSRLLKTTEVKLPLSPNQPPPPPPPPPDTRVTHFRTLLKPEIDAGKLSVDQQGPALRITINFKDMFPSGEASLRPELQALLTRIGQELKTPEGRGNVEVIGHTDNDPIRTARFQSNMALSQARANNAADAMIAQSGSPERYTKIGKADTVPIADNATAEGKAKNRRIEIRLIRPE